MKKGRLGQEGRKEGRTNESKERKGETKKEDGGSKEGWEDE